MQKYGSPDPHVGDYSGKTAFEIAADFGTSRLEIAHSLRDYAKFIYAPNIVSIMTCAERQRVSLSTHNQPEKSFNCNSDDYKDSTDPISSSQQEACPFQYLSQLNTGALSLISRFLACEQLDVIAALSATEKRLGLQSTRCGSSVSNSGANNERFAVFSPLKKFDPRSRSLPYLLRQAEAEMKAAADARAAKLAEKSNT
jgi:hypothetical protein